MAKPNKRAIESLLEEWARLRAQAEKIEQARDAQIQIETEKFNRRCDSIQGEAKAKLEPTLKKLAELEDKISKPLLAGVAEDGTIALPQVVTERAFAAVNKSQGPRRVDPVKFFALTPTAKRDSVFWNCVTIGVAPAEKLLGKLELDKISSRATTHEVEIKMKKAAG